MERTNPWYNGGSRKLAVGAKLHSAVIDALIALANRMITILRLIKGAG